VVANDGDSRYPLIRKINRRRQGILPGGLGDRNWALPFAGFALQDIHTGSCSRSVPRLRVIFLAGPARAGGAAERSTRRRLTYRRVSSPRLSAIQTASASAGLGPSPMRFLAASRRSQGQLKLVGLCCSRGMTATKLCSDLRRRLFLSHVL
jgi:hypothetical protein